MHVIPVFSGLAGLGDWFLVVKIESVHTVKVHKWHTHHIATGVLLTEVAIFYKMKRQRLPKQTLL